MRYSASPSLDAVYELIGVLYVEREDERAMTSAAMTIAAALVELGEDRSWASVWWAYGAIHYDLSDAAYDRGLELLVRVDEPPDARAAALMLQAEIKATQAIEHQVEIDQAEQIELLSEAVELAPDWPNLRLRLAIACESAGDTASAKEHAQETVKLLREYPQTGDPFDWAMSGRDIDRSYVTEELTSLGLLTQ